MKRNLLTLAGSALAGAALLATLSACTSATAGPLPAPTGAQATASPTPPPAGAPAATVAPSSTAPGGSSGGDALARGRLIFEKTAGGVGCAYCHGMDGKGEGVAGLGAPDIRGAPDAKVRAALGGGVPLMSFIDLSDKEIEAVVAYLQYLNQQP